MTSGGCSGQAEAGVGYRLVMRGALFVVAVLTLVSACTAGPAAAPADPVAEPGHTVAPPSAAPVAPPAACLLDPAELAVTTGVSWTPDEVTASDVRCVYDPSIEPGDPAARAASTDFLAVDLSPTSTGNPVRELDTLAELCDAGTRAAVTVVDGGFVCRFRGGNVFAAAVRGGQRVTVATSAVPRGTSTERLLAGLAEQLEALR